MQEMAKSFQRVREMKGAENAALTTAIQNISNPFNNAAITANEVASKMKTQVLSLVKYDLE